MSEYPRWWDSKVTLYNKYTDSTTHKVTWYKTVLSGCFWKNTGGKANIGSVVLDTSQITCRVPKNASFLDASKWISTTDRGKYFTFNQGDILVLGSCDDNINEYVSGSRSTDLLSKYKDIQCCMEIKSVNINTMTGFSNPHYCVKGI